MPVDFKKTEKHLYQPKTTPSIIDVPEMVFIAVDGRGDPNTSREYASAIELLYGLSYGIKMTNRSVLEYVVLPLEGLWIIPDNAFAADNSHILDKGALEWTALIRQPDFVTEVTLKTAVETLAGKKPGLETEKARLLVITEGLCVQSMHIGSYDDEPATITRMREFANQNGYAIDHNDARRHHEIYLSDPRRVASEKLKTVIRLPLRNRD